MDKGIFIVVSSGILIGLGCIYFVLETNRIRDATNNLKGKVGMFLSEKLAKESNENILSGTHYYLNINTVNYIRYGLLIIFVLLATLLQSLNWCAFGILIFFITLPVNKLGENIKMPYFFFCEFFRKLDRDAKDKELIETISLLKNIMVQMENQPLGADYIVEYLANHSKLTKTAFLKLLNQLRLNRYDIAEQVFYKEIGTKLSKEVAKIIMQLDKFNPSTLKETLSSVQRSIRESKITEQKLRDEKLSDIALIPGVATIMLIFINFIVVAYLLDLKDMWKI